MNAKTTAAAGAVVALGIMLGGCRPGPLKQQDIQVSLKNRMTVEFVCRASAPILIQSIALTDQMGHWQLQKAFIANYNGKVGVLWSTPEDAAGKFKPVDAATCKRDETEEIEWDGFNIMDVQFNTTRGSVKYESLKER